MNVFLMAKTDDDDDDDAFNVRGQGSEVRVRVIITVLYFKIEELS